MSSKMHKFLHIFLVLLCCVALSSCRAYVDVRREAGLVASVGQSKESKVAICYNPLFNEEQELEVLAKQSCKTQKVSFQNKKYFNCTLFYPNTAFYECN